MPDHEFGVWDVGFVGRCRLTVFCLLPVIRTGLCNGCTLSVLHEGHRHAGDFGTGQN
eukprot:m.65340 g.65340  ORF g.65340 m.65340 type:complete len:57 (+) comp9756_c0_seq1:297-467(+)